MAAWKKYLSFYGGCIALAYGLDFSASAHELPLAVQQLKKQFTISADSLQQDPQSGAVTAKKNVNFSLGSELWLSEGVDFFPDQQIFKSVAPARGVSFGRAWSAQSVEHAFDQYQGSYQNFLLTDTVLYFNAKLYHRTSHIDFEAEDIVYSLSKDADWKWYASRAQGRWGESLVFKSAWLKFHNIPIFWTPSIAIAWDDRSISGLLPPELQYSAFHGFQAMLPVYWLPHPKTDLTFSFGAYTLRGLRAELSSRYHGSETFFGSTKLMVMRDQKLSSDYQSSSIGRFFVQHDSQTYLAPSLSLKADINETSDNIYIYFFQNDFKNYSREPVLPSRAFLTYNTQDWNIYMGVRRYRNALYFDDTFNKSDQFELFDPYTIQVLPEMGIHKNDFLIKPLCVVASLDVDYARFVRKAGFLDLERQQPYPIWTPSYDVVFQQGALIREANRFVIRPKIYRPFTVADVVGVIPSLSWQGNYYFLQRDVKPCFRHYLLFSTEVLTTFEKRWYNAEDQKMAHYITPMLRYDVMPFYAEDASHPLSRQLVRGQQQGFFSHFDDRDIIPYDAVLIGGNYYFPQGHALSYGVTSKWVQRTAKTYQSSDYKVFLEASVEQTLNLYRLFSKNFVPLTQSQDRSVFSRVLSQVIFNWDPVQLQVQYAYDPAAQIDAKHLINLDAGYIFAQTGRDTLVYAERSLRLIYTFNKQTARTSNLRAELNFYVNDFIYPGGYISYGFLEKAWDKYGGKLELRGSLAAWKVIFGVDYRSAMPYPNFTLDIAFNFSGERYDSLASFKTSDRG